MVGDTKVVDVGPTEEVAAAATSSTSSFFGSLTQNPLFSAGVGVASLGVGFALFRQGALRASLLAQRHLTVSLEIPSKDRSYQWVLQWINSQNIRTQHLGVETTFLQHDNGSVSTKFDFVPSPGRHLIHYNRHWIQVVREREKTMIDINSGTPWETVTLTAVGRSHKVFDELLEEARTKALKKEEGKTVIYTSLGVEWRPFGRPRRRRPLTSVVLKEGIAQRLVQDVQEFCKSQQWYIDRGIPYRRGYLLHGPPGCGKSSFILALAGFLEYNICILNLNERGLSDDRLNVLLSVAPPRSLILLEDIDAAFTKRENSRDAYPGVTFSGLLNCLDGVASTEERLVFMTTNHLERLDAALVRPGRVDMIERIGEADRFQILQMFNRFYTYDSELGPVFADLTGPLKLSMAQLQGVFLMFKDNPQGAIDYIKQEFGPFKPEKR